MKCLNLIYFGFFQGNCKNVYFCEIIRNNDKTKVNFYLMSSFHSIFLFIKKNLKIIMKDRFIFKIDKICVIFLFIINFNFESINKIK